MYSCLEHVKKYPKLFFPNFFILLYIHSFKKKLDISVTPRYKFFFFSVEPNGAIFLSMYSNRLLVLVNTTHWVDKSSGQFLVLIILDHLVFDKMFIPSSLKHFFLAFRTLHTCAWFISPKSLAASFIVFALTVLCSLDVGIPRAETFPFQCKSAHFHYVA